MPFTLPGTVQSLGLRRGTPQPLGQVGPCLPPILKAAAEGMGHLGLLRKTPWFSRKRPGFLVPVSAPGPGTGEMWLSAIFQLEERPELHLSLQPQERGSGDHPGFASRCLSFPLRHQGRRWDGASAGEAAAVPVRRGSPAACGRRGGACLCALHLSKQTLYPVFD